MDWEQESKAVMHGNPFTSASAAGATRGNPESSCHPERSEGPRSARFLGRARFFVACWLLRMTIAGLAGEKGCQAGKGVRYPFSGNAQRAGLVKRAEEWRWSSVYARQYGNESQKGLLSAWSVPEPGDYLEWVNRSQPKEEVEKIRHAVKRSRRYGSEGWVSKAVAEFGLENTVRNPWRPGKGT